MHWYDRMLANVASFKGGGEVVRLKMDVAEGNGVVLWSSKDRWHTHAFKVRPDEDGNRTIWGGMFWGHYDFENLHAARADYDERRP